MRGDNALPISLFSGMTAEWSKDGGLFLYDPYKGINFFMNEEEWRNLYDRMTDRIEEMKETGQWQEGGTVERTAQMLRDRGQLE